MKNNIRVIQGIVISKKMKKSIVVLIKRLVKHPIYRKFINKNSKIHAHDLDDQCHVGDIVEICECKPISKMKSWNLIRIIKKSTI